MNKETIKPLADYIAVRIEKDNKQTESGILLTSEHSRGFKKAEVVAINELSDIEVGSTVMVKEWAGFEVTINDEKLMLVAEEDVLGVWEDAE